MIKHFTKSDINALDQRTRVHFINSLSGFKSANLIGTTNDNGTPNLAMISSVFHIGANPPLVGHIIRPDTVPRDTLSNLTQTGSYTINHVSSLIWQQAHQTSARYAPDVSEFERTQLSEEYIDGVKAPFVAQSQLKFALEVREITPLKINGTILVIGEISHVLVPEFSIQKDGYIDIESIDTVTVSGLDSYHTTDRLARLAYAKAEQPTKLMNLDGSDYDTPVN